MTLQSIYRLCTEGQNQASQYIPRSLRSLGGYNYRTDKQTETPDYCFTLTTIDKARAISNEVQS